MILNYCNEQSQLEAKMLRFEKKVFGMTWKITVSMGLHIAKELRVCFSHWNFDNGWFDGVIHTRFNNMGYWHVQMAERWHPRLLFHSWSSYVCPSNVDLH